MLNLTRLDHLVLTVRDISVTYAFYHDILGMEIVHFGKERIALRFGDQKINLHQAGQEILPAASHPTPGSADLCFLTNLPLPEILSTWLSIKSTSLPGRCPVPARADHWSPFICVIRMATCSKLPGLSTADMPALLFTDGQENPPTRRFAV